MPLTFDVLELAMSVEELDFEDAIHYATMKLHGIDTILSSVI